MGLCGVEPDKVLSHPIRDTWKLTNGEWCDDFQSIRDLSVDRGTILYLTRERSSDARDETAATGSLRDQIRGQWAR